MSAQPQNLSPELSATETMLLCAERYAEPSSVWQVNVQLLHRDEKVQAAGLCRHLLMAALLDGEAKGVYSLTLRTQTYKRLFGLLGSGQRVAIYATPRSPHAYPEGSLEAQLANLVAQGESEVRPLVYALLGQDAAEPWVLVFNLVVAGLYQRGLVLGEKVKHLLWSSTEIKLPSSTLAGVLPQETARMDSLLAATRSQRADVWQALERDLIQARNERVRKDEPDERVGND